MYRSFRWHREILRVDGINSRGKKAETSSIRYNTISYGPFAHPPPVISWVTIYTAEKTQEEHVTAEKNERLKPVHAKLNSQVTSTVFPTQSIHLHHLSQSPIRVEEQSNYLYGASALIQAANSGSHLSPFANNFSLLYNNSSRNSVAYS